MLLFGKIALGTLGTMALAGAVVSSEGFIHVKVHENAANGTHLSFIVPAMLVPITLKFVPKQYFQDPARQIGPWMPVIDATLSGLYDCADNTTLVDVTDPGEHFSIVKSSGAIVVDVQDPGETVHVAVPLRAMRAAIHEIAEGAGPS
ncbi:MAG TPA: hypothetical protein VJN21_09850 [Candidatus Acidoferrales bacterium]|nr:hypothetical protein [Candidatus Acidoferrales bacterium]